jgi:hypothetical protein
LIHGEEDAGAVGQKDLAVIVSGPTRGPFSSLVFAGYVQERLPELASYARKTLPEPLTKI